jgi:hypothetical protein
MEQLRLYSDLAKTNTEYPSDLRPLDRRAGASKVYNPSQQATKLFLLFLALLVSKLETIELRFREAFQERSTALSL